MTITHTTSRTARPARRRRINWAFLLVLLLIAVLLFPIYWMILTAVLPTSSVLSRTPSVIPLGESFTLDAFVSVLTDSGLLRWFGQSALVTIGAAVLSTALSVTSAYALSRFVVPGRRLVLFTFLMGRVLPGTLLALPFFILFKVLGLLDSTTGVILANTAAITPFTALMMKSYFDGIPRDLDEAAMVDGCSRLMILVRVLLPVSVPGIAAGLGFAATSAWTDLLFSRTLLLSDDKWTVPMGIASMVGDVSVNWNQLMATGVLSVLPVLVVYWFLQPYMISGMTSGSVKG